MSAPPVEFTTLTRIWACGHCGSIVGYFNGAVEHALYKGFIVVLCEVVRPLGGFHGDLNVVKFGIVAGYEAEGCDLAAVVSPIAVFNNVFEGCLDGCAESLHCGGNGHSHNTLRGAAGGAVELAELLTAEGYITAK